MTPQVLPRRRPALFSATLVLLGVAAAVVGQNQAGSEHDAHQRMSSERVRSKERLASVDDDLAKAAQRAVRFRELIARGHVGPEQRLEWTERIAAVRQARGLFEVHYDFSAQRLLDGTGAASENARFEAMASTMKFSMPLLHEGDLLVFLDDLADVAPALLRVRECRIERMPLERHSDRLAPRLSAACSVDWITLRERT